MQNQKLKIVVLISGSGTNLQAIIDATQSGLPVEICAVISNRDDAYGLVRAREAKIPAHVISHKSFETREAFDEALQIQIDYYHPQLVVLAGFMRRLESIFIAHYRGRLINIHPSLLPKYRGLHTHRQVLESGDKIHGSSIHFVSDDLDDGAVIAQIALNIQENETEESLKHRVQALEHKMYPTVLEWFAHGRVKLHDDQVEFDGKLLPPSGVMLK